MTNSEYDSTGTRRFGMTLGQRLATVLLATVTVVSFLVVLAQREKAGYWRHRALAAEAALVQAPDSMDGIATDPSRKERFYKTLLVGVDGKTHAINGKAIQIFTGEEKMLEVRLDRQPKGRLLMWSPSYRDDEYFHRIIVRPACSNVLELELEKVSLSNSAGSRPGAAPLFQRLPPQ